MISDLTAAVLQRVGLTNASTRRTGVLILLVASFTLSVLTYLILRNLDKQHSEIQRWQSKNLSSQVEWLRASTRITIHQMSLLDSVANFVAGSPGVTREKLVNEFDTYWSWYSSLDTLNESYYDFLIGDEEIDESTRAVIAEVATNAVELQDKGAAHLRQLEQVLLQMDQPDSSVTQRVLLETGAVRLELVSLGESMVKLIRVSMQAQEWSYRELIRRLFVAFITIATVVSLGVFGTGFYVLQKNESNKRLRGLGKKLSGMYTEQSQQASKMKQLVYHDSLSGLLNREGYYRELRRVIHEGGDHGVVFLDLDMFKIVIDAVGRKGGDVLIRQIGNAFVRLCKEYSNSCSSARLGDDEFVFLCRNYSREEFDKLVHKLHQLFTPMKLCFKGRQFRQTASMGAYYFDAISHTDDSVMERVDAACLEAKRLGGNRVRYYTDENSLVSERQKDFKIIEQIHGALDQNRFVLYYQPIVALTENGYKPYSYEFLIRMSAKDGSLVPPGAFLGVAERYGLMPLIDQWVVNEAIGWLARNDIRARGLKCINVNLSGLSINDQEWIEMLVKKISSTDIDPSQICFEITESSALYGSALGNLKLLREIGVRLSLDDFGSGFSSFEYLEKLPIDQVKIDGAFIRDLDGNAVHQEFIRAIAAMCHALNKHTVGEFVENKASMKKLRELGVHYAQGYHIAAPLALHSIATPCNEQPCLVVDVEESCAI